MIKKISILFTILFAITLLSCKQASDDGSNKGPSNIPTTKTYINTEDSIKVAAILEADGIYSISFGIGNDITAANNNIVSGIATKSGNTYTCSNLIYNAHLPTKQNSNGTLTITVNGNTATVTGENIDATGAGFLNGTYTLTEQTL